MTHYPAVPDEYKVLFRFSPPEGQDRMAKYQDIPEEYAVCELPDYPTVGLIGVYIWGRYDTRWFPNVNARPLIKYLLDELHKMGWVNQ